MAMDFGRSAKKAPQIPTSSMGDIVFLLLIFFMVTTVFRKETGLVVELPRAEAGEEAQRDLMSNIYIDRLGRISVDDRLLDVKHIRPIFEQKVQENPLLLVSFKTDNYTPYEVVSDVMEELKEANAVRVLFQSDVELSPGTKY
jgi:biopolymer transport protein ExbD